MTLTSTTNVREYADLNMVVYTDDTTRGMSRVWTVRIEKLVSKSRFPKPLAYYYFSTPGLRDDYVEKFVKQTRESQARRAEWMAQRRADQNQECKLKVGQILSNSWGYDQTQVDFYVVTGLVGKRSVKIRKMSGKSVESTSWGSDTVVATEPYGDEYVCRVTYGDHVSVSKMEGFGSDQKATPWYGSPLHRSWYA